MRTCFLWTVALLSAAAVQDPAEGGERLNRAGRWLGFGWSDGYHACQASHAVVSHLPPRNAGHPGAVQSATVAAPAAPGGFWGSDVPAASALPLTGADAPLPLQDVPLDKSIMDRSWQAVIDQCDLDPPAVPGFAAGADSPQRDLLPAPVPADRGRTSDRTSAGDETTGEPPAAEAPAADELDTAASTEQPHAAVASGWIAMPIFDDRPQRLPPTLGFLMPATR